VAKEALKAAKEAMKGQVSTAGGSEQKEGQSGKSSGNARKGKESGGSKQTEKSDLGGKAEKPRKTWVESHWKSSGNAYKGVPQNEINFHKNSKANCWQCGQDSHTTQDCYALTMVKGTQLPKAPKQASSIQGKRKREEEDQEVPAAKQNKVGHVKTEDDDMWKVAGVAIRAWQDDPDFQ